VLYNTEPLNSNLRIEEPSAEYTINSGAYFEIPESQRRELQVRLAHHRANPNERKYSLSEIMADRHSITR
jgi:hypothetical protein